MTTIEWGEWIDDPWRLVRSDEYWDALVDRGVRTADLMIDTSRPRWDPMFTVEQIELFSTLAIGRDIEPVCLGWPAPVKSILDNMLTYFKRIARYLAAIGLDSEHLWRTAHVRRADFASLNSAADYALEGLRRIRKRYDVRIELTTHSGHREATSRATLTPHVDRFYLQPYTTRHDWRGNEVPWSGHRLSPGIRQREDIERVRKALPCLDGPVKLCIGQALYDQKWPGHTVDEALDAALDATIAAHVTSVRGWSSKWDVGVKSSSRRQQDVSSWVRRRFKRPSRP